MEEAEIEIGKVVVEIGLYIWMGWMRMDGEYPCYLPGVWRCIVNIYYYLTLSECVFARSMTHMLIGVKTLYMERDPVKDSVNLRRWLAV